MYSIIRICVKIHCLQPHYEMSTVALWTLYSLLWTLYRLSTAYYRLSTDSLQPTTDSLQTLYSLYRLSTDSLQSLQTLYSLLWTGYSCLWLSMPPHCSSAAAVLCSAVQNIEVATGSTALQALCSTAAALCSVPEFADAKASAHMRWRPRRISIWSMNRIAIVLHIACSGCRLVVHHGKHPASRTSIRAPTGGGPPIVQHDDYNAVGHAVIDPVRVDGYMAHHEGRPPRVTRGLRDADEGTSCCVCRTCTTT